LIGEDDRQRLRIDAGRLDRADRRFAIELGETPGRREGRPFGRIQARDAAAFLIDEDRQVAAAGQLFQPVGEAAQLIARSAIAGKEDEAGRPDFLDERALIDRERLARKTDDGRQHRAGLEPELQAEKSRDRRA
jgi:hypothetical protein